MLADGRTSRQTIARLRLIHIQPMACCSLHKNKKTFAIKQTIDYICTKLNSYDTNLHTTAERVER